LARALRRSFRSNPLVDRVGSMAKGKTPGWVIGANILGMLSTGTLNTLCTKIQFTISSIGKDGHHEVFQKPWFATLNMLAAMAVVGVVDWLFQSCRSGAKTGKTAPLMIDQGPVSNGGSSGLSHTKKVCLVAIPGAFDILATALASIGMLYIPASVWQMLRGSSIVFAAMFSITFLKRKMFGFNWVGLALCVAGVFLVGLASVGGDAATGGSAADMLIGMSLVIAGQVVQAAQIIAEEFLMKNVDLPALRVVGLEGAWGTLIMLFIAYPLLWFIPGDDHGHVEDPVDTWYLLKNSMPLVYVVLLFLFSCATFNATGIAVTQSLSGVHRMMLDASRTVLIWAFGLAVHYYWDPNSPFGEVWTDYSYLQMAGFVVLVSGQAVYGEVLKVPGLHYPPPTAMPMHATPSAALKLASPLPREA